MVAQVIKKQIDRIEYIEKIVFWFLLSVFVTLLFAYSYFLCGAMMNAIAEQNIDKEIASLNTEVNALEYKYLNLKNSITMELALANGFVNVDEHKFAVATHVPNTVSSLSINEN